MTIKLLTIFLHQVKVFAPSGSACQDMHTLAMLQLNLIMTFYKTLCSYFNKENYFKFGQLYEKEKSK